MNPPHLPVARPERCSFDAAPIGAERPFSGSLVVAQDISVAVTCRNLEVPVIGREPSIEDRMDFEAPFAQRESARFLVAAVARVAFDL